MSTTKSYKSSKSHKHLFSDKVLKRAITWSIVIGLTTSISFGVVSWSPLTTIVHPDFANLFLATIAQVLAGIIAIVFTVLALVVSLASDRYNANLLSEFLLDPLTILTFIALLGCMLVALFAIGISWPMYQLSYLIMIFLVTLGIGLLLIYLRHSIIYLSPNFLAENLCEDGKEAIDNEDAHQLSYVLSTMGDIALKALNRTEEEVTKKYLTGLNQIQLHWIKNKKRLVFGDTETHLSLFFDEMRSPILDQYARVSNELIEKGDSNLVRLIGGLIRESIYQLTKSQDEEKALRGLLAQYRDLVKCTIEHQNSARFSLSYGYRDLIWQESIAQSNVAYISVLFDSFAQTCGDIIDANDEELGDRVLYYFCSGYDPAIRLRNWLRNHCLSQLQGHLFSKYPSGQWKWIFEWQRFLISSTEPLLNARTYQLLVDHLTQFGSALPDIDGDRVYFQQAKTQLFKIYVTDQIILTFFTIGKAAYASDKYPFVKTLWKSHNSTPYLDRVPTDLSYSIFVVTSLAQSAERFAHDQNEVEKTLQYCFLYFAFALQKISTTDWGPKVPGFNEARLYRYGEFSEIIANSVSEGYEQLVQYPSIFQKIASQHGALVSQANELNIIFDEQAKTAFENAYNWLTNEERYKGWLEKSNEIVKALPFDPQLRNTFFNLVRQEYKRQSRILFIATIDSVDNELDGHMIEESVHQNKKDFTFLTSRLPHDLVFSIAALVARLANKETAFILQRWLECHEIEQIILPAISWIHIVQQIEQRRLANGFNPSAMLLCSEKMMYLQRNDPEFAQNLTQDDGLYVLNIDANTRLRIFQDPQCNNHIYITDPASGNWNSISRVEASIEQCPKNGLRVHLNLRETVCYELIQPQGIIMLQIEAEDGTRS